MFLFSFSSAHHTVETSIEKKAEEEEKEKETYYSR
jgi:hypothetical protein